MTPEELVTKIKARPSLKVANERLGISSERWIVEGDIGLAEHDLLPYAKERIELAERVTANPAARRFGLIAIEANGKILRWRRGKVLDYCVWRPSFATDAEYDTVVRDMAFATADWSAMCGVTFQHVVAQDENQNLRFGDVTFPVLRQAGGGDTVAMAFFPDSPLNERVVWIFDGHFGGSFDPVGVLRHELGHVLGFRHEHIVPEAPDFFHPEPTDHIVRLTEYDPRSVMHYVAPGVGDPQLRFTDFDRTGARQVYGDPDSSFTFAD